MKYDLVVVGGRVAGSIAAYHAAKNGLHVLMLEGNPEIGTPVQCAGGVSDSFFKSTGIKPLPEFTCTRINSATINGPYGASITTRNPIIKGYIIERKIFDKYLALRATEAGADVLAGSRVNDLIFHDGSVSGVKFRGPDGTHEVESSIVIAADGIQSGIGRMAGLDTRFRPGELCSCAQYEVAGFDVDDETMEFYFGSTFAPSGYLWVFPKGDGRANVGVGIRRTTCSDNSPLHYLNQFISRAGCSRLEFNAGAVPIAGPIRKTYTDSLLVVGDAAGQVDPLTGGGIHVAAKCAMIAADVATEAVESQRTDSGFLSKYESTWHERIGKNLERSLKFRKVLDGLSDDELDSLIRSFEGKALNSISKISLLKILRDYPGILKMLKCML
ncbi:NAD(P)/FAD-dependent oxidoreductase [Methanothermobacter marburgensis]|uniref:Digeranylgeranylglycerophospholipid reductase n=1 Tax=Methanothermobacter marburgensis (strain ATCC BAA-927 / DSM 2133 / JCM 14651 / NBRC 100331 / OCM 82 / Marburg) TaxID=79929 RepID=D9PUK5_METTM|nr:NAD(P)/FAD-dependent oxidoreductase [Methanothermobacter marburgensis]ADL57903.1 predicted dehydrogenase [Methanothermobacter marburgensis str. Marburg]WBF10105.1 NAD(P)/FAD-dependent oxidoreductase [Methanothermobacter marburgensis]